jgi:hypothetical protein
MADQSELEQSFQTLVRDVLKMACRRSADRAAALLALLVMTGVRAC